MRYSIFDAVLVVLRPSSEVLLLGDGLHDDLCQELSTFPCRMDAVGLHDAIGGHAFSVWRSIYCTFSLRATCLTIGAIWLVMMLSLMSHEGLTAGMGEHSQILGCEGSALSVSVIAIRSRLNSALCTQLWGLVSFVVSR